jgi:hypothetical protein
MSAAFLFPTKDSSSRAQKLRRTRRSWNPKKQGLQGGTPPDRVLGLTTETVLKNATLG